MYIAAKVANDKVQIEDRKNRGAEYVELHTSANEFENKIDYKEYMKFFNDNNIKILSVHSPMKNKYGMPCGIGYKNKVTNEVYSHNMNIIKESIKLASSIISEEKKIVVIHLMEAYDIDISKLNIKNEEECIKQDIIELSEYASEKYPDVILAFENNIKIFKDKKGNIIENLYGTNDDYIKWINDLNLKNVGATLDICHALGTIQYNIEKNIKGIENISEYIYKYSSVLKHIHLANAKNFGLDEGHGTAFNNTAEDIKILKEIFKALKKIDYKYNIVIETSEIDVSKYENYSVIMDTINTNLKYN